MGLWCPGAAARTNAGGEKAEEEDDDTESEDDDEAPDEIEQHTVHKRLGFTRRASEDNVVDLRRLREDAVASAAAAAESDAHGVSIKSSMNNSIGSSIEESMTAVMPEKLNARAVKVIKRVQQKLDGRDFTTVRVAKAGESSPATTRYYGFGGEGEEVNKAARGRVLSVEEQVDRLIMQATSDENLCQSYIGWYVARAKAQGGYLYGEPAFRTVRESTLNLCALHSSLTPTTVCAYIPLLAILFWPFVFRFAAGARFGDMLYPTLVLNVWHTCTIKFMQLFSTNALCTCALHVGQVHDSGPAAQRLPLLSSPGLKKRR